MSNEACFSKTEDGALTLKDEAWVSAEHPGGYEISAGDPRDNTEYARKASAGNQAEMYAARQLFIMHKAGDLCPVLAVSKVRVLGTVKRNDSSNKYGKEFLRLAVPTPVMRYLYSSAGKKIKLPKDPIEKSSEKDGYTMFTASLGASCTLGAIVASDDGDDVTEVVSLDRDAEAFCGGKDFDAACTFVVKAKYKGKTVPLGEIPKYSLVLEPCSITITDVHDTMLDPNGSAGTPKMDLGASVPTTVSLSSNLINYLKALNIE